MSCLLNALQKEASRKLWFRGALWLAVLGPFFFLSYNFAGSLAEVRQIRASLVFGWERWIPFRPWTILAYWSLILACIASFFSAWGIFSPDARPGRGDPDRERQRLDRHGERLLLCQLLTVACFLLMPLRFSYTPPRVEGFLGGFFAMLYAFDQPYNQIPSLHVALLTLIAARCSLGGVWRGAFNSWVFLVGISVLTTWQQHFIGALAGLLLGGLVLWAVPDDGPTLRTLWREGRSARDDPDRRVLARIYAAASFACLAWCVFGWACWGSGAAAIWLFLAWSGLALGLTALVYARLGPAALRKRQGGFPPASLWLFWPYLAGAWLNSRWWTRGRPAPDHVADRIWIGRMPGRRELERLAASEHGFDALLDLAAELPAPASFAGGEDFVYAAVPLLEGAIPDPEDVGRAVLRLDRLHRAGRTTLVCCALGEVRSALVVAVWLSFRSGAPLADAVAGVARRRRGVALYEARIQAGQAALRLLLARKRAGDLAERLSRWRAGQREAIKKSFHNSHEMASNAGRESGAARKAP